MPRSSGAVHPRSRVARPSPEGVTQRAGDEGGRGLSVRGADAGRVAPSARCGRRRSFPRACRCALTLSGFSSPSGLSALIRSSTSTFAVPLFTVEPHPGIHRRLRVRGRSAWRRASEHRDEEERRHTEQRREKDTSHVREYVEGRGRCQQRMPSMRMRAPELANARAVGGTVSPGAVGGTSESSRYVMLRTGPLCCLRAP